MSDHVRDYGYGRDYDYDYGHGRDYDDLLIERH
ncbi:hypothetical protein swp_2395 [Shewanella piezotolerans WP3]|uniref:Uncharacterized protein n=1 Tax=Shewanella piezotolerans (strain WP3 / JCM 13877) TaxID=225849 RepID=B8CM82_SHEPW|nr:hypothetical protein swp_2395 [Shewanella piezotolerans WP3]